MGVINVEMTCFSSVLKVLKFIAKGIKNNKRFWKNKNIEYVR
jgi:hypothetical protein